MLTIEVLNDYSEPVAPLGFVRALKLIDPKLSLLWHREAQRWMIVTFGIPREAFRDGYVVEHIVSRNNQFAPLNEDVLAFLRKVKYERDKFAKQYDPGELDHHLMDIYKDHEEKITAAEKTRLDGFSQAGKLAHKFRTTETFI